MKKLSTRSVLFVLLIAASICSYIYLNTVTSHLPSPNVEHNSLVEEIEEAEESKSRIVLPDVQLLKKIFETGRKFLPAS